MPRVDVEIPTPDGTAPATLSRPEGDGPWPGVVLFPDAGGRRETMLAMADRLAGTGYVVLVPDVYYRAGDWDPINVATAFGDPAERARMGELVGALTNERIEADAGAYLRFLLNRPEVSGTTAGTTGYCMGGRMSLLTSGLHPELVGAAASFHGGRLAVVDDPTSPHLTAGAIRAEVLVAGAIEDGSFTDEQAELLRSALDAAGVTYTLETWPAHHGFSVADNPTYDEAAAERHWSALEDLYSRQLA